MSKGRASGLSVNTTPVQSPSKGGGLSINTAGGNIDSSFDLHTHKDERGDAFRKGNLEIHSSGVVRDGAHHRFKVVYEDLDMAELIGRGCSSFVLRATHRGTGQALALKVMNMFEKGKRDQLIREISALYDANHCSLIKFFGAFYREGAITIVMEYMDGGSLSNVLHQVGPIPEFVLANITYQILEGLTYLKQNKRVHRDVKPSNLLINSQGEVKVTDFGVSAELQSSIAMCGTFVGTFKYMSPERMKSERYGYSSDIWSLGLVIMECATNRYPYQAVDANAIELVQTIVESASPKLDPAEGFSQEFCSFMDCCLRKDPAQRIPADVLRGSAWLTRCGAVSLEAARANVKLWIDHLRD